MKKIKKILSVFMFFGGLCGCFKVGAMENKRHMRNYLINNFDYEIKDIQTGKTYTKDMFISLNEPNRNVIEFGSIKVSSFLMSRLKDAKKNSNETEYIKKVFSDYVEEIVFANDLEIFSKFGEQDVEDLDRLRKIFEILKNNLKLVLFKLGDVVEQKLIILKEGLLEKCFNKEYVEKIKNIEEMDFKNLDYDDDEVKFLYCLLKLRDFVVFYNTYSHEFSKK